MGVDRYLKERVYHIRRKQMLRQRKNTPGTIFSVISLGDKSYGSHHNSRQVIPIKKLVGIGLIVIALLLLLSQCFFKANAKTPDNSTTQLQEKGGDIASSSIDYYTKMQDFPLDPLLTYKVLSQTKRHQLSFAEGLAKWCVGFNNQLSNQKILRFLKREDAYIKYVDHAVFTDLVNLYEQFIYDIACFPVSKDYLYSYEDSWKNARQYKGDRAHFGTDIMANNAPAGTIPVQSMSDGIVENIGWNELGGYRVGIRSNGGAYFYYAHLDRLPTHIKKGDKVRAGQVLGMMGDTGYGEEGTRGKFPVHLHVGIALKNKSQKEFWINPHPILKYLEYKK